MEMKFEEAIRVNGMASLDSLGYVEFNNEGILVDDKGKEQLFHIDYLQYNDWHSYYGDEKKKISEADFNRAVIKHIVPKNTFFVGSIRKELFGDDE